MTQNSVRVMLLLYLSTKPWKYTEKWRHSSTILDLGTRWRWVVSFTLLPPYSRWMNRRYLLSRRLGGLESRSWSFGEEKNLAPSGMQRPWLYRMSSLNKIYHRIVSPTFTVVRDRLGPVAFPFSEFIWNYKSYRQSVGLLGWGISPSQGCCLHGTSQTQKKADMPYCLEWDSNPRP
jgi:hypothetical protein